MGGKLTVLLVLVVAGIVVYAVKFPDRAQQILAQLHGLFSGAPAETAQSSPTPAASATPVAPVPEQATVIPDSLALTQSVIEAYMVKNAAPQCTFAFLDWSGYSITGPLSTVIVHYSVQQPGRQAAVATVQFTVQGENVLKAELVPANFQRTASAAVTPPPRQYVTSASNPLVVDFFTSRIDAAKDGPNMSISQGSAFSLSQLKQAIQKARVERKPLGFLMVWGEFFDQDADTRGKSSTSALVHFYQVFHENLVLVFVRHETELNSVPPAVKQGFFGPDEGGYAPNMAVTDASAAELITEIPFRDLDGKGRDQIFADGGKKIDQWMALHPLAMPTPGSP